MRKFYNYLIAISAITLLLMFFLDNIYSYAFQNGQPRSKIQNILQLKDTHYDIAFFGSSRTEQHIDCKLITKLTGKSCVNYGISGGHPGDMLILMKLAENRKITFNQVFMQLDYNYSSFGISEYFRANLVPFIDNPLVKEQLTDYKEDFFYSWIPFYRFMIFTKIVGIREATASFLKLSINNNIEIAFSPNQGAGTGLPGNFSFPKRLNSISPEFTQMQKLYKDTNTTFSFFTSPYCNKVKNREYMDKVQLKLPDLHNYIDLFDNKDEYFFNCGHLNEVGAEVFTKTIVEDLLLKK